MGEGLGQAGEGMRVAAGCSPSPSGPRSPRPCPRLGFVLSQSGEMRSPRGARTLLFVALQPAQREVWEPVGLFLGLRCGSCASSCCRQRRLSPPGQDVWGQLLLSSGNALPNLLRLHKPRPLPCDLQGQAHKLETAQGGCCRSPPRPSRGAPTSSARLGSVTQEPCRRCGCCSAPGSSRHRSEAS